MNYLIAILFGITLAAIIMTSVPLLISALIGLLITAKPKEVSDETFIG